MQYINNNLFTDTIYVQLLNMSKRVKRLYFTDLHIKTI